MSLEPKFNIAAGKATAKLATHFRRLKPTHVILIFIGALGLMAGIELSMGRLFFGPDGRFGFWETSIWSSENSQRLADPYSFSHIVHGIAFYGLLWLVARKLPVEKRLLIALSVEVGWELLENSPIIINRYREATVALGYTGDSVMNSMSDVLMMTLGFLFARWAKPVISLVAVAMMEIGCALWVRDNLTLNIIMLIHPVDAIKHWQLAGQPHP
ncbi:MAG TPA: DUF2585 family protein [Candidatus Acidoferrales bacterium]|jgi:hypothetical protein|nr:DUF2585 family protein [Candidatus Acidoferrales bacterium]